MSNVPGYILFNVMAIWSGCVVTFLIFRYRVRWPWGWCLLFVAILCAFVNVILKLFL